MAPLFINSTVRWMPAIVCRWTPSCVASLFLRARSVIWRTSQTLCAMGFSQNRCLPRCRAHIDGWKCVWSGVATVTASISFSILSNITRKS